MKRNDMNVFLKFMAVAALVLPCIACGHSSGYKVTGTVDGLENGDTIILTNDLSNSTPLQKVVVTDGGFTLEGVPDSVALHVLYVSNRPDVNVSFFLEPADISIHLSADPSKCSVSGTKANDAWHGLNAKTAEYNQKMRAELEQLYDQGLSEQEKMAVMDRLQAMEKELVGTIVAAAEQNLDNEMGFFVVTHFEEDAIFPPSRRLALIEQMPAAYRNRSVVKELKEELSAALSTEAGHQMADFTLPDTEGKETSAMSLVTESKLTIIDFWASWCGPCRQEMPSMVALYKDYQEKGLGIVGVSLDEDRDAWTKAIRQMNMSWPQLSDLRGWNSSAAVLYQVKSIPQTIVVDSEGKILAKGLRGVQLRQLVEERLGALSAQ